MGLHATRGASTTIAIVAATYSAIGAAAATCLSRAIARAIYEATPADGDIIGTYR